MWPQSKIAELLGIMHPIIQAPMSGYSTPQLVAAVCNAGALGSLGCATLSSGAIRDQVAQIREATNRAFNLNFFVHPAPSIDVDSVKRMREHVAPFFAELGLGEVPNPSVLIRPFDQDQLELILELRPRVVSFHFGLPSGSAMQQIKASGSIVLSSATSVSEARQLETGGVDAVIAQGAEAGGHRGTFAQSSVSGLIGTLALVPQVVDAVRIPVIAAGGIADGRGIAAAFALGASGVQMGTAFLGCPEASVLPVYREALLRATDDGTQITRVFTGRPARALRCRLMEHVPDVDALDFPLQASLLAPLWQISDDNVRTAFMPMWAGQAVPLLREMSAGALVDKLVAEAHAILRR